MISSITEPLNKEGNLWIFHHIFDSQLLPRQVNAIRSMTHTVNGRTTQALFHWLNIINGQDPGHPSATALCTMLHGLTKRCSVCCWVIQRRDYFEIRPAGQWQNKVASTKTRVATTVAKDPTRACTKALNLVSEMRSRDRIRDMI
jgi:hypothetical protein